MSHNPFEAVIESLRDLKKEAETEFKDKPSIKTRVVNELTKLDNFLCAMGKIRPEGRNKRDFGPIQIEEKPSPVLPEKSRKELEAETIKEIADEVEKTFMERESHEIVDAVDDIVVRVIAKRAGIQVTETDPEKITIDFVEEIKAAKRLNASLGELPSKVEDDTNAVWVNPTPEESEEQPDHQPPGFPDQSLTGNGTKEVEEYYPDQNDAASDFEPLPEVNDELKESKPKAKGKAKNDPA